MEIKIYYQDTDCGGVVYYANYLTYFERARTEWLEQKGILIKELAKKGIKFIVTHSEVDYKSPAQYGETLKIETCLEKISNVRMELSYKVCEKNTDRPIVTGRTTLACVNNSLRPCRLPEEIKRELTRT